jgi:hypothetical protein
MDPYIEDSGLWADFHDDLIAEIKRTLAAVVPERYLIRTGERSYVVLAESNGKESHPFIPDVGVTTPAPPQPSPSAGAVATAAENATGAEVVTLPAFIETR